MSTSPSPSFDGLRVAAFESRLAGPMADMIARHGGVPLTAPAMREVTLGENPEVHTFAEGLREGRFDVIVFETGVGVRYLAQAIETLLPRDEWLAALERTKVVARGPKPTAALRELKVRIDLQVPEPNTWHETLAALDERLPVRGLRVAVQEYGQPNADLIGGLEERGAVVTRVPVYRWALPEDLEPLRAAIAAIAAGQVGAVLFTAAQQVIHLLQVAADEGREADLRAALERSAIVGSIGPITSEVLRDHRLPVDIVPEHPKMGHLVLAVATRWREIGKRPSVT